MVAILRFLFLLGEPVGRKAYAAWGFGLMIVKYAFEAGLLWYGWGKFLSPIDFLNPLGRYQLYNVADAVSSVPAATPMIALGFAIPFIWIGVNLSMRRAVDAGLSPWTALIFFVPFLNIPMMLLLAVLPPVPTSLDEWRKQTLGGAKHDMRAALIGVFLGSIVGLSLVAISVYVLKGYGVSLFVGTPLIIGTLTAYIYNREGMKTFGATLWATSLTLILTGGGLLLLAMEGAICIAMAVPIAVPLAAIGAFIGRETATRWNPRAVTPNVFAIIGLFPLMASIEAAVPYEREAHVVLTTVEVNAPPEAIWPYLIEFPDLQEPEEWFFKLGIAHPLRARLEGRGVGAVRYCQFSTGDFVEPITTWDEPNRLAFDVQFQPLPMKELSPYEQIHAPHLDGFVRSEKGEFRLVRLENGKTRLEGRTWYKANIKPAAYWEIYSDYFIHEIHIRVLNHIKTVAEAKAAKT